jgi:Uma2 family endonuclease
MAVTSRKRHVTLEASSRPPVDRRPEGSEPPSDSETVGSLAGRPAADHSDEIPEKESPGPEEQPGPPPPVAGNLRELYDHLVPHLGRWRAEIIDGRLVVSPVGSPENQWRATLFVDVFLPLARERGWRVYPGLDVCLPGSRTPLEPDFAMAPKDAPRWGEREVFTDGLVMVGEIVSPGSVDDDRHRKPGSYARGGVPLMLLVDPVAEPPTVTVFSRPRDGRYAEKTEVEMGEKLHIPEPVDHTLDTAIFLD